MSDAERLRRRYQREHDARLQAEAIAERAIADLYATNQELDARVAERTRELEMALERARSTDAVRAAFIRGLAHEMSTPLHAVSGLAELLQDGGDEPAVQRMANDLHAAASRLNLALRTLLEFAAISGGDFETAIGEFRIGEYLDTVIDRWRLRAARAGMLLVGQAMPEPQATVHADSARLDQILDALLDNAIRHGNVQVTIDLTRDDAILQLAVGDDGPGVPAARRDAIFAAFARGDGPASDGVGVGLTLARAVAEALGGTLELADTAAGARFVARLPLDDGRVDELLIRTPGHS